jgi:hypothetical protein
MRIRPVTAAILLLLNGCDPFYGVESRAKLQGPVNVGCVGASLSSIPEDWVN